MRKSNAQCYYFCCFVFPDHLRGLDPTNAHSQAVFPNQSDSKYFKLWFKPICFFHSSVVIPKWLKGTRKKTEAFWEMMFGDCNHYQWGIPPSWFHNFCLGLRRRILQGLQGPVVHKRWVENSIKWAIIIPIHLLLYEKNPVVLKVIFKAT